MNKIIVVNDYIVATATTPNGIDENADEVEYMLCHPPIAPEGKGYRLKTDLTWELYDLPTPEPTPITPEDLYTAMEGIL